jgi:hypothetical protein
MSKASFRALSFVIVVVLGAGASVWRSHAGATPPKLAQAKTVKRSPGPPPSAAARPSAAPTPTPAAPPPSAASTGGDAGVPVVRDTARIIFTTTPAVTATVMWGKKSLGVIAPRQALVVVRPRDSGPLDVIVRAPGYLPVQTRAHTFSDSRIVVKLTPPDQKNTLIGYRQPIDAGTPPLADGEVPPLGSEAPAALPAPVAPPPTAASH